MKKKFTNMWKDPFNKYLILFLIVLGIFLLVRGEEGVEPVSNGFEIDFFYSPTCPHCAQQKIFNEQLVQKYPVRFIYHDITKLDEAMLLIRMMADNNMSTTQIGVPTTLIGNKVFIGFKSSETTGKEIENAVKDCLEGKCNGVKIEKTTEYITLPLLGEIKISNYSLPMLAVMLGLVDGFNPCAMWVLVYLIGLVLTLNDRRRIWLLVGTFVFASGALYFLFMTAWLNVFLFVGYLRPITIVVGLVAFGTGIMNIREYVKTKGVLVCPIDDGSKRKTMSRMEKVIFSPLNLATVFGIIVLAFVVNSIEFVCSSAIPAIFTQVLALHNLPTVQYYGYILLYDLFFMLDDLIIFSLAVFAATSAMSVGHKYTKYSKVIGGLVLLLIGFMLLFTPSLLR